MVDYNTNLKVNPPLRSKEDMMALRNAVLDGTVDFIASHHIPQDWDKKNCEFEFAGNGIVGLETAFAVVNHILPELTNNRLVELFSINARRIFGLDAATVATGNTAELSLFNRTETSQLTKQNIKSKSFNTPFLDTTLSGKVIGTFHNGKISLN